MRPLHVFGLCYSVELGNNFITGCSFSPQSAIYKIFMVDGDDGAGNKMKEARIPARLVASGRVLMGLHSCCSANVTEDIILGDLFQY